MSAWTCGTDAVNTEIRGQRGTRLLVVNVAGFLLSGRLPPGARRAVLSEVNLERFQFKRPRLAVTCFTH
jgi:hypothetical protein